MLNKPGGEMLADSNDSHSQHHVCHASLQEPSCARRLVYTGQFAPKLVAAGQLRPETHDALGVYLSEREVCMHAVQYRHLCMTRLFPQTRLHVCFTLSCSFLALWL